MGWADEAEQAVNEALSGMGMVGGDAGPDPATGGGQTGAGHPGMGMGGGYDVSGQTTGGDVGFDSTMNQDAGSLNAITQAVKEGVQQAIGTSPLAKEYGALYNPAFSDFPQNPGLGTGTQFGNTWEQTSDTPFIDEWADFTQATNAARIRDAEARMRANIAALGPKIGALVQSLNPFKSDWAQKNLYGTTQPTSAIGYLPAAYKDAVAAKAWVDKNYPSDVGFDSTIDQSAGPPVTSQQVSPGVGDWSQDFQTPTQNLSNVLNKLGGQGLLTGAALAEETLGAPGSWYGQTPIQVAMGTGAVSYTHLRAHETLR